MQRRQLPKTRPSRLWTTVSACRWHFCVHRSQHGLSALPCASVLACSLHRSDRRGQPPGDPLPILGQAVRRNGTLSLSSVVLFTDALPTKAEMKDRLLVISNFRVMTLKTGAFGKKALRHNYSLFDLKEIVLTKHVPPKVRCGLEPGP